MNELIFALFGVRILLSIVAITSLIVKGLWRRYPLLAFYLGMDAFRSCLLIYSYHIGGKAGYLGLFVRSQSFEIAAFASLILEWYFRGARTLGHRFVVFGAVAMGFFIAMAAGFVLFTANIAVLSGSSAPQIVLAIRYYKLAFFMVLVLLRLFFRAALLPESRNHKKHGTNLLIMFGGSALGALIGQWNEYWTNVIAQFLTIGPDIWVYANWAGFRAVDERTGPRPPRPSDEEARRSEEELHGLLRRAWRAMRDAIRGRGRQPIVFS